MSTSVIGEEPSASLMVRSTSATSRTSVAVSSLSSSRPSSSKGASSTIVSSQSLSRPSSSKGASSTTASSQLSSRPSSSRVASSTIPTMIAKSEPGSSIVQYTTIPALFRRIAHATEEIITVHGIPSQEFTKFFEQREEQEGELRKFLISLYTANTECMVITFPTSEHEGLHGGLDDAFRDDAVSIGLGREFVRVGSTTFKDRDTNGNITSEGEGDSCRKPKSMRTNKDQYPTLVIEASWSQTLQSLREKVRWWFDKSNGDVKIVLLVKMSRSNHIQIEKWKLAPAASRGGATTTRAATTMTPQCVHVVEIARAAGIDDAHPNRFDPASYVVTSGPLQLEFIDIFLRQPIPPGERDLIIGNTTLQEYAADFWESMH